MNDEGKAGIVRMILRYVLPVVILAAAISGARALMASKPEAARQVPKEMAAAVRTIGAVRTNHTVHVQAMGNVVPARRVELRAQVGGRVIKRHPSLEVGGHLVAGDVLVEIEAEDYEAAVAEAQAALAQARLNEALELQRQAVATGEWKQSGQKAVDPASMAIAMREPYVEAARRTVAAAEAAVERAMRNLERTRIKAPFSSVVLSTHAETGSVLAPQSMVAVLAASDVFHIEAALPVAALDWIGVLKDGAFEPMPDVTVTAVSDAREVVSCEGRVVRLLGDMSQAGLMARVLVAVDRPYEQTGGKLLLGAYAQCTIAGKRLDDVHVIPRSVIRDDETLWIADADDRLKIIEPVLLWKGADQVILGGEIGDGMRIISSALPTAIPGMRLQVMNKGDQAP
jgi:RND family efflux transporter MFP subunit